MNHFISSAINFMIPYLKSGLSTLVGIAIIGYFGFLIGNAYSDRDRKQGELESEQRKQDLIEEQKEEQKKEEKFNLILEEACSRTATESASLDLYRCKALKEEEQYLIILDLEEIEAGVSSRKDIIPCNKNISESKLIEIVDCLNFGDSELE